MPIALPPFDRSTGGCSAPEFLSKLLPAFTLANEICRECCVIHDEIYYYGGTREDRRAADLALQSCIEGHGFPSVAEQYFFAVRLFGGPQHRIPKVSWAFGGSRFVYDTDLVPNSPSQKALRALQKRAKAEKDLRKVGKKPT
jgi:hypothetical protein